MSSLLPFKPTTASLLDRDGDPKLVDVTDPDADQVLSSISSTTARNVLAAIYEEPQTASDIARTLDTSVQNVSYHLDRLAEANLVEVAETWYSRQGREMDVYAAANGPLVLYIGAEEAKPTLTAALSRVFGAVGAIGIASAFVHHRWSTPANDGPTAMGGVERTDPTFWESLLEFAAGPGGLVLVLGLLAIVCWFASWYWGRYRPYRRMRADVAPR